jgi:hypothetical protein
MNRMTDKEVIDKIEEDIALLRENLEDQDRKLALELQQEEYRGSPGMFPHPLLLSSCVLLPCSVVLLDHSNCLQLKPCGYNSGG